jgi:hypothetical protein
VIDPDHDEVLAKQLGKTAAAVTRRHWRERIAAYRDRRKG